MSAPKQVFNGENVSAWPLDPRERVEPIAVYIHGKKPDETVRVTWYISVEAARRLAGELVAAADASEGARVSS